MTQASVQTETKVEVSTWTASYNYATNQVVSILHKIANQRGLGTGYLTRHKDILEDGIYTWLCGRYLEAVHLEVYDPETDEVVERPDFEFVYTAPKEADEETVRQVQEQQFEALHREFLDAMSTLEAPPEGCRYRLVVSLIENEEGQEPPPVAGWSSSSLRSTDHLREMDLGQWLDAGAVRGSGTFWHGSEEGPGVDR